MSGWRHYRGRISILILSCLLALTGIEIGLRCIPPAKKMKRLPVSNIELLKTHGLRDSKHQAEKPPGCFRILGLGDSITWGHGMHVDDTFLKRIERRLNKRAGAKRIQALNFSECGMSTHEEMEDIHRHVKHLDPDLILVGFCLNDAEDHRSMAAFEAYRHFIFPRDPGGLQKILCRGSELYRLIYRRWENLRVRRANIRYYRQIYQDDYPGYRLLQTTLRDTGYFLHEAGIPAVLIIFPLFQFPLNEAGYPFIELHEIVRKAGEQHYFFVLDLFSTYSGMEETRLMVDPPADPHPNEIAHRIAADRIQAFLQEKKLIPQ